DLDGLAGLRVAAHASLAFRLYQAADAGDYKDAVLLGLLDSGFREQLEAGSGLLVGDFQLLGHVPDQGGLGHSSCHAMFSFWASPQGCRVVGFAAKRLPHEPRSITRASVRNPCIHAGTKNPADGYNAALRGRKSMEKARFPQVFSGFCPK